MTFLFEVIEKHMIFVIISFIKGGILMDESDIYLFPYTYDNINLIVGWNVMISPEGEVYKIYERGELQTGHDLFASTFVSIKYKKDINEVWKNFQKIHSDYSSILLAPKDILIDLFGFVNYEYNKGLELTGPDYNMAALRVTDKQVLVIDRLIELNKDSKRAIQSLLEEDCKENKLKLL